MLYAWYVVKVLQVSELDREEENCRAALLENKQKAARAAAEARCAAESATQRSCARVNELHACVSQQKAALAALQDLHERIVQAPADVVNRAVVAFQRLQARGCDNAFKHAHFPCDTVLQDVVADAEKFKGSASTVSSFSVGALAGCASVAGPQLERRAQHKDAYSVQDVDVQPCMPNMAGFRRADHAFSESSGQADTFCSRRTDLMRHSWKPTETLPYEPSLSISESESDWEDYEPAPCRLVPQGGMPYSQVRWASQLHMRKLALRALHAWSDLRLAALDAEAAASAFCRMACTAKALRRWYSITGRLAQWRTQQLQKAMDLRQRMMLSWVLHAWHSFVMDQHELLHKFLVLRCAHSRRLQLAALAALWIHASTKKAHRDALRACRQRVARKLLHAWRNRVLASQQRLERVLEFVATCAQRVLHRSFQFWRAHAHRKCRNRCILETCAQHRAHKQCRAAFACWAQQLRNRALLQRVFAHAEKAWEEVLQVRDCCTGLWILK